MDKTTLSTLAQLEWMTDLQRAANQRAAAEESLHARFEEQSTNARTEFETTKERLEAKYAQDKVKPEADYAEDRKTIEKEQTAQKNCVEQEFETVQRKIDSKHGRAIRKAEKACYELHWQVMTVYDAEKGQPRLRLDENLKRIAISREKLNGIERESITMMRSRRMWSAAMASALETEPVKGIVDQWKDEEAAGLDDPPGNSENATSSEALLAQDEPLTNLDLPDYVAARVMETQTSAENLPHPWLPRLYSDNGLLGVILGAVLLFILPIGYLMEWSGWHWAAIGAGLGLVAGGGLLFLLFPGARRHAQGRFEDFDRSRIAAQSAVKAATREARLRAQREADEIATRRDGGLATADNAKDESVRETDEWRDSELARANETFPAKLRRVAADRERRLAQIDEKYPRILQSLADRYQKECDDHDQRYAQRSAEITSERDAAFDSMASEWRLACTTFDEAAGASKDQCSRLFPNWNPDAWNAWDPPADPSPAIRFGHCRLNFANVKHAISSDDRLQPAQTVYDLPALMTLGLHPSLVLTTGEEGRRAAIATMQSTMLRFLTATPPGKVRFTIIDPLGLGDNFAAFMHLADHDELLVTNRIWTESGHIERRLADLTEHMENVLQKYLRSEFESIHDYNEMAGEVAEPFRVLVIANFPANFTDTAARRLSAILAGGARCGVYTIIHVDRSLRMLSDYPVDEMTAHAVHLDWKNDQFLWRFGAMERLPLTLETPPPPDRFREIVSTVGELAVDANRVEVPFDALAPAESEIWSEDCSRELLVPIGRSGANKWQSVRLGHGTAQHLLVAGKTGSGKSTFLHALITSAALRYSPEQLRFYLIDFKKGVEFKTYATGRLPHADVIAIESEREFGLSVLDRLDRELRSRGDLFRSLGVQDLAAFRSAEPDTPMPRILLIIDEFQELFVDDDKIAQQAALLLDRLVRQGRAFGIHVVLGSQTLAGAYSLARSTLGQMAVRIALQCSEADAHLILSEDNTAARLLSRPGEAIYNDQNGIVAGNHPFQVVWFTEPERERHIGFLRERQQCLAPPSNEPPIVFEGNVPADLAANRLLSEAIELKSKPTGTLRAWLGAAVQIKDPTAAVFRRQGGSNLMIVGQKESLALGMMSSALVGLAVQSPWVDNGESAALGDRNKPRFFVLDGTRPESPEAGYWEQLADALSLDITIGNVRESASIIEAVSAIVTERSESGDDTAPSVFLCIHNLGRFRDLRRRDDDFSFSSFSDGANDKPAASDKRLGEILREGPAWGVHTMIWADSYNSVQRAFDRMTMREIELRVAMQLSATDSSSLIDTPAAGRLGPNRALLYSEDEGSLEKFRPYAPPSLEWLESIATSTVVNSICPTQ